VVANSVSKFGGILFTLIRLTLIRCIAHNGWAANGVTERDW